MHVQSQMRTISSTTHNKESPQSIRLGITPYKISKSIFILFGLNKTKMEFHILNTIYIYPALLFAEILIFETAA